MGCEEESYGHMNNCSHLDHPRTPISINLSNHIKIKNHQNYVPINDRTSVRLRNISFHPDLNKLIIKRWKRLVKDGDITEVKYSIPRNCTKCGIALEDSIDMFKHIKDVHVKT